MRPKKQKPPICIGGSEKLRALDCPRYMNVPSPAPCHAKVAGVGKQSVWGLRIIACSSSSLLHHSRNSSIPKVVGDEPASGLLSNSSPPNARTETRYRRIRGNSSPDSE